MKWLVAIEKGDLPDIVQFSSFFVRNGVVFRMKPQAEGGGSNASMLRCSVGETESQSEYVGAILGFSW